MFGLYMSLYILSQSIYYELKLKYKSERIILYKVYTRTLNGILCQEYSMKYIYSTSQISKLSLTLHTFSVTGSVAGLFLTKALL